MERWEVESTFCFEPQLPQQKHLLDFMDLWRFPKICSTASHRPYRTSSEPSPPSPGDRAHLFMLFSRSRSVFMLFTEWRVTEWRVPVNWELPTSFRPWTAVHRTYMKWTGTELSANGSIRVLLKSAATPKKSESMEQLRRDVENPRDRTEILYRNDTRENNNNNIIWRSYDAVIGYCGIISKSIIITCFILIYRSSFLQYHIKIFA